MMSNDVWLERQSGWKPQSDDARDPFEADFARIIHSGSFRRLQSKTQILNLGESDFYRTRLTHSLEAAQIAGSIAKHLERKYSQQPASKYLPPLSLIQTAGFSHDLGHPPFGHGGEIALNYCMRDNGGFEGNGHTLRLLSKLEQFSKANGADLTRRSLLAVLKYPVSFSAVANRKIKPRLAKAPTFIRTLDIKLCKPPKCYFDSEDDVVDWMLRPLSPQDRERFQGVDQHDGKHGVAKHKSFDCSIMDVADDIAYGVHDLEDMIALGLIREDHFRALVKDEVCASFIDDLKRRYPKEFRKAAYEYFVSRLFSTGNERKHFINRMVYHFVTNIEIYELKALKSPLIRFRARIAHPQVRFLKALQELIVCKVIQTPNVQHFEFKGQKIVVSVFEALCTDPKSLLPEDAYCRWNASGGDLRVICDYVAGMTDTFLLKTYDRLFSPWVGSVFDKL